MRGRAFHSRVAQAAETLQAAEIAATSMLDEPRGRLRVTAPVELGTRTFGLMLGFSEAHPEVHLDLDLSNRFVNLAEEGFDVALRGGRPPEGSLTGRSLGSVEIHIVASPDYLASHGTPSSLARRRSTRVHPVPKLDLEFQLVADRAARQVHGSGERSPDDQQPRCSARRRAPRHGTRGCFPSTTVSAT